EAICQRAMRFDVAERTPSAAALRDELDAYLRGDAPSGGQGGRGSLTLALGVLGAVLALGGVGLGVLATRAGDRDPGAEAGPAVALPNGPPQVVPRAKEDERWRGPPSSRVAALARNYASVAQARAQLKEATPETLELLYAVHYRLARSPVWQAVYLDPIAGGAPGRVRPPASVFVQRGKRLITYGGRLPPDRTDLNKVEPGFPKAWTVETGEEMTVARDASGLFVKANVAFPFPKPSRYGSALLFESARRFMAWHADGGAQGLDGSEATMNGYRAKLEELPQWKVSEKDNTPVDKPVTAAAVRGDGSEFALGTGRTGYHLREGALRDNTAVVVRMPYPLRTEDMERTPAAHCEEVPIGQEAVRGLAYGPGEPPPLWILGGRELICWRDGEVETRAEGDAEWFALVVDGRGRPLVGGAQGLTQFDPLGERPSLLPLDDLASVDGLALVGESHAVAVGTSPTGKGAWALLELPNQGEPRVLCSRETDLPYASVAVSEESRRACFMRWDGEFEVWDLDALFPWSEALAFPRATTTSAGPVRPEGAAVELGAQDYAGKSLAEARRSLPAGAAYREQILQRVAANNAKRPLWEGKHAEVDSADGAPPPRSCFLAHNRLVTFGGGRAGGAQAGPKSWSPDGASVVDPTQGRIEVRACFADPRWPNDGILLQGLQDDPLRLDESGTSLGQDPSNLLPLRASWPSEVREALGQHRKLVSVATYAADRRELLLGTVPQGEPAGARVLRIPLHAMPDSWYSAPERESTSSRPTIYNSGREAFNPGAAALSPSLPFDEPVRAIGRGTQRTVWILGRRALVRWQGDSVEGVATAGASERWRDL
ncbi:MAG: hypothetical protein KDD82_13590, partial [Planctomycetes bacterium]|nr:hypothetical protein [Planctomycetota bacterium]